MARRMVAASTRRTTPLCMKSMPSTMPTGRAVRKLPDTTRTVALAIGVFGRPLREGGFDLEAQLAGGFLRAVERHAVGDALAVREARGVALGLELLVHLRAKAMHQHQLDAHRVQDREVLHEGVQLARGDRLADQPDHEGLAVVGVDVRRDRAEPGNEGVREHEAHAAAIVPQPRVRASSRAGARIIRAP